MARMAMAAACGWQARPSASHGLLGEAGDQRCGGDEPTSRFPCSSSPSTGSRFGSTSPWRPNSVSPITWAAILLARTAAADVLRTGGDDTMVRAGVAFKRSLAHSGIAAWEGIGDTDGNVVEPTPDNIDALLELWPMFDSIDRLYVGPALIQDAKKTSDRPCRMAFRRGRRLLRGGPRNLRRLPYLEHAPTTPEGITTWACFEGRRAKCAP